MRPLVTSLVLTVLVAALPAPRAMAQDKPIDLLPSRLEVGQVGYWRSGDTVYKIKIIDIVDAKTMLMELRGDPDPMFLVKRDTKGLVEDKFIELPGLWKVTGTAKHGGKTRYVLEPYVAKK